MEKYSVLMPLYYKEKPEFLRKSIESMVQQTVKPDDFVIVEDGPLTDELYEVLNEYERKYDFIHRIVQKENLGCGASLNNGLRSCKNELIARMDSDDISLPNRCEKQLEMFEKYPELGVVGTAMYEFSSDENNPKYIKFMPETPEEVYKYGKRRIPFSHPTVMYRKSVVYDKHNGYCEERGMDDSDLFPRLMYSGVLGRNINEPLLKYRSNEEQYRRRINLKDSLAVIRYSYRNYKMKYTGLIDLAYVVVLNLGACLLPIKLRMFLFKKMTRKNANFYKK